MLLLSSSRLGNEGLDVVGIRKAETCAAVGATNREEVLDGYSWQMDRPLERSQ